MLYTLTGGLWLFLLGISYIYFVYPIFSYAGYNLNIRAEKFLVVLSIYIPILLTNPKRLDKPSDFYVNFLTFAFYAPICIYYPLNDQPTEAFLLLSSSIAIITLLTRGLTLRILYIKTSKTICITVITAFVVLISILMLKNGGLKYFNLNLTKVYIFREDAGDAINSGYLVYLNIWTMKAFGPILFAYNLLKSRYYLCACILLLHVFWFGVSSHKSVLFYPLATFGLWILFKNNKALIKIPLILCIILTLCLSIYFSHDVTIASNLFIRRIFFTPAQLTFEYFEYFKTNGHLFWSNSILSPFIEYPYDVPPAKVIGAELDRNNHANNSFLSAGYMHAGYLGVILYSIIVGMLFKLVDSISHKSFPSWFIPAALFAPFQSLMTNADLPTALLTHGILISLVVTYLLRNKNSIIL